MPDVEGLLLVLKSRYTEGEEKNRMKFIGEGRVNDPPH